MELELIDLGTDKTHGVEIVSPRCDNPVIDDLGAGCPVSGYAKVTPFL